MCVCGRFLLSPGNVEETTELNCIDLPTLSLLAVIRLAWSKYRKGTVHVRLSEGSL